MQKIQKTYTPEFKREAVQLAQTSGKPIAQVAREPFAFLTPPFINGAKSWLITVPKPSQAVDIKQKKKKKSVISSVSWKL
jgi:hypothetical protein